MRPIAAWVRWVGAAAVLLAALGCGNGEPPVYPVHGKILFGGKPMQGGGSIALVPLEGQKGKGAGGEIAADGTYRLTTHTPGDGSMTGKFRVVINQVTEREPEQTRDGEAPKTAVSLPAADRIPTVYGDTYKSPLTATVEAKNPNEIDFTLKRE